MWASVCSGPVPKEAKGWSTDLLVKNILERQQKCPVSNSLTKRIHELENIYLGRLGIMGEETDRLFRMFIAPAEEVESLSKAKEKKVEWVGPVAVAGASAPMLSTLKKWIQDLGSAGEYLWDARVLYRVKISSKPGIAAFIPEFATLLMSSEVLESPSGLHHLVFLHELAHVAEQSAELFKREKWKREFAGFSGWPADFDLKVERLAESRSDELTNLSEKSSFSFLPDPVLQPKGKEGFAFAKSYRNTLERKDHSEDIADHVAAFFLAPQRFCFKGKPLAVGKYNWVRKKLHSAEKPLRCEAQHEN